MWVVAQLAEHRTVTAGVEGSSPFDPPKFARNCGRGVRHLIVDQADDGSSPFSSAKIFSHKEAQKKQIFSDKTFVLFVPFGGNYRGVV